MDDAVKQLIAVQDRDIRIYKLRQMIETIPEEKEKISNELQGAEELVETAKTNHQQIQIDIKDIQSDVEAIKSRITQLQMKSTETKKNEEFRAILAQIEKLKEDIVDKEDKELELMESLEGSKDKLAEAEKIKQASDARIKAAQDDLDIKEKNCLSQIEKIEGEREELTKSVPEDLFRKYERIIAKKLEQKIFRKGIAEIVDGSCGYCHLTMTADAQIKAKKGFITCSTCGTILYA